MESNLEFLGFIIGIGLYFYASKKEDYPPCI